jgi:hypothetical protein
MAALTFSPVKLLAEDKPNIVMLFIYDWAWNGSPVAMDDDMQKSVREFPSQIPNTTLPSTKTTKAMRINCCGDRLKASDR